MAETEKNKSVIAQGKAVTMSNRPGPRNVVHPADRPGIVIFLHGVNDPGANYDHIEKGLCEGLNERLSRSDLRPGEYGATFVKAQKYTHVDPDFDQWKGIKYDPDTYLYKRTEVTDPGKETHSMFIPFYWGYRAASSQIKGGEKNPSMFRGQYQDIDGNRLSKTFAKGGGMFNNATTNIPEVFGPGFQKSAGNWAASKKMSDYQYSTKSPDRTYYVLAAARLAMLIREIRRVNPNETVSVMAHSQGTVITLLAQAMLAESKEEGSRCADCIIMVDTPYSLGEPLMAVAAQPSAIQYTTRSKLNTLINIVKAVTKEPHAAPSLDELNPENPLHGGRTGKGWSPKQASRLDKDGSTYVFAERDNRGKVYLYFCPEDTTVGLISIKGVGTYGVPNTIDETWATVIGNDPGAKTKDTLKAMDELKQHRFYQRLWSKGGNMATKKPSIVGKAPEYVERIAVGATGDPEDRLINAEAVVPPYDPRMYGDEAVKGTAAKAGQDKPDYVARDTLLGNPNADLPFIPLTGFPDSVKKAGPQAIREWFNSQSSDPQDHTDSVRKIHVWGSDFEREETPNETRSRLEKDRSKWDENSYHSAILRDSDNIRRVAAMDVAIGQAMSLDDPDMRNLLIAIADWKIDAKAMSAIQANSCLGRLTQNSQDLILASFAYYTKGTFPSRTLVPSAPPKMVDKETVTDRMVSR